MDKPVLIIIDGPMGSGKTALSKNLQKKIGNCALLSIDVIKKFTNDFHNAEKSRKEFAKYDIPSVISQAYLNEGSPVIIEHSFGSKKVIDKLLAANPNARIFMTKVDSPLKLRIKRVLKRDKPIKEMKDKLLEKIAEDDKSFKFGELPKYNWEFDTSKQSLEEISDKIIEEIKK